jgi:hypothetical protein
MANNPMNAMPSLDSACLFSLYALSYKLLGLFFTYPNFTVVDCMDILKRLINGMTW